MRGERQRFPAAPQERGLCEGLRPSALPMWEHSSHALRERALRPAPRVPFVSRRKEPKACQGRCPWTPLGGIIIPPAARRAAPPQKGDSGTDAEGFAILRWCGQLDAPSSWALTKRNILLSIRGSAGRMVASLRATLGLNGGIGEGGFWKRTGNEVAETKETEGAQIQ